jgi:hypothetical protein
MPAHLYLALLAGTQPLEGPGPALLVPGELYTMPLIPLEGCVVAPGEILPHRLVAPFERAAVRTALAAPAPLSRLFTVVCAGDISVDELDGDLLRFQAVGVTVEIMRASRESVNVMCRARQRVRLELEASPQPLSLLKIAVRVLPEPPSPRLPPGAALPPFLARRLDPEHLAAAACEQFEELIGEFPYPDVPGVDSLSYWLVSNLPLDTQQRQALLESPTAVDRIFQAMRWAGRATGVQHCRRCRSRLAPINALLHLGAHPLGGHYVNNNGVVHDMLTVERASGVRVVGYPEGSHSWFENYAWQICYCRGCGTHVGWLFTAIEPEGEQPVAVQRFFGMRRSALTCCGEAAEEGAEEGAVAALAVVGLEEESSDSEEWEAEEEGDLVDLNDEGVQSGSDSDEDGEEGWR